MLSNTTYRVGQLHRFHCIPNAASHTACLSECRYPYQHKHRTNNRNCELLYQFPCRVLFIVSKASASTDSRVLVTESNKINCLTQLSHCLPLYKYEGQNIVAYLLKARTWSPQTSMLPLQQFDTIMEGGFFCTVRAEMLYTGQLVRSAFSQSVELVGWWVTELIIF
jgi:hypothetical protein